MAQGRPPQHQDLLSREPGQPDARDRRHRGGGGDRQGVRRATLVVDNVFATPLWQKPLELGADCVVYSTTKHVDGQGRCLGGVVLGSADFIDRMSTLPAADRSAMSPFNAWVMLKGLETLSLRVERQTRTAASLADALVGTAR
jgi:O-succinylhomoserine sulfhydrylase